MSLCVGEWISVNHVVVCVTVTVYGCNPVHVPGLLRCVTVYSCNHVHVQVLPRFVTVYSCNPVHVPGLLRLSRVDVSHTRVDVSHTRVMFHTFVRFECCALYL